MMFTMERLRKVTRRFAGEARSGHELDPQRHGRASQPGTTAYASAGFVAARIPGAL